MGNIFFEKVDSATPVVSHITDSIAHYLENELNALWLIAGGSAMGVAIEAVRKLKSSPHLSNLTVTLTDERHGAVGHADSNWQQLLDKGFSLPGAKLFPVLTGGSLEQSAQKYSETLNSELEKSDYSIALAGMGADGHIFGIKPHSPAVNGTLEVIGYDWDDYIRLTPTIKFIERLDEVVVYAMGKEKWPQFDKLALDIPASEQPAQLLKKVPKVTIYNDYIGTISENI